MKLSINSIVVSILLASGGRCGLTTTSSTTPSRQLSPSAGPSFGAAYFITNDASGNFLIAGDIGSHGQLTLRTATDAGGLGAHGISNPLGQPDPLFSQGAVTVSAAANIVATVNAASNTLALFSINPNAPSSVKMIGKPVGSGGEFPLSVAINNAGNTVCALNGGVVNGVACFKVDMTEGLVPIANTVRSLGLNQTTPPSGPPGSASNIIFSEDNSQIFVAVKGHPQPGFLAAWDIAADGSLSTNFKTITPPQPGGILPFSMSVLSGQNALLVTDAAVGFEIFDLAAEATSSALVSAAGVRSSVHPIAGQGTTCWAAFSTKTGTFFLTDMTTSIVTEVSVSANLTATIVKQYPQTKGSATLDNDVATIQGKDFLYILAANITSIDVLALPAPGKATNIQTLDISGPIKAAGINISPFGLQGMATFVKK